MMHGGQQTTQPKAANTHTQTQHHQQQAQHTDTAPAASFYITKSGGVRRPKIDNPHTLSGWGAQDAL